MTDIDYTHLLAIVDRSGSMWSIERDMNGGLKSFLDEQKALPGKLLVDIVTFDTEIDQAYSSATVDDIKFPIIAPRGGTALQDAIGQSVVKLGEKLASLPEDERPGKVIVMIVTDGQENSSHEFAGKDGSDRIKQMIETQRSNFQWEFLFLGANIDSFAVGGGFGIPQGAIINYTADGGSTQSVLRSASAYVGNTRSGLAASFTDADRQAAGGN